MDAAGWSTWAVAVCSINGTACGCLVGLYHAVLEGQKGLNTMNRDWCQFPAG